MLAIKLHEIEAIKFGSFLTKSGRTPICFNFGSIVGHPDVLVSETLANSIENRFMKTFFHQEMVSNSLLDFVKTLNIDYKHVCGIPYNALLIATLFSNKQMKPMLIRRSYENQILIEGKCSKGDSCLIIEDIFGMGSSVLDTVKDIRTQGR